MAVSVQAYREWSRRPNDQRYTSLEELRAAVYSRKQESWTAVPSTDQMQVVSSNDLEDSSATIGLKLYDQTAGEDRIVHPTNWAFGQLAQYGQAPASYLQKLPAPLAAINLQWGLEKRPLRPDSLILAQSNGDHKLRAMTSVSYGRIWDHQVVDAVVKANHNGRWQVPVASHTTTNSKRATTLYASDRDVFIFLVDPENPVEVDGDVLFRGFFAWNSEVGSATFGLTTFLYRYICDNRIVMGMSDVKELRIRHSRGAPERFAYEGERYLKRYAEESTGQLVDQIKTAKNKKIEVNEGNGETVEGWLQKRGFTKAQAKASVETAQGEEGDASSVWDVVNGITAHARSIPFANERVELEAEAGALMKSLTS